jgi:hypothetical protein
VSKFCIGSVWGVTLHPDTLSSINLAATSALNYPTSFYLNKNYRFKLVISILSKSITFISENPLNARSLSISHPSPPAPITNTLANWVNRVLVSYPGSNS